MQLWVIVCRTPSGLVWYRQTRAPGDGGIVWTTLLDNADVYTDDELPDGDWDKVRAEELSQ